MEAKEISRRSACTEHLFLYLMCAVTRSFLFLFFSPRERRCLNPQMTGLPAMSTFRTSFEQKRTYIRAATALATKSAPPPPPLTEQQGSKAREDEETAQVKEEMPPPALEPMVARRPATPPPSSPSLNTSSSSSTSIDSEEAKRPNLSYAALIVLAIRSYSEKKATLQMIYQYIMDKFPYFRVCDSQQWQNSIRHNLTIHKAFVKGDKQEGKGSFWSINSEINADQFFKKRNKDDSGAIEALKRLMPKSRRESLEAAAKQQIERMLHTTNSPHAPAVMPHKPADVVSKTSAVAEDKRKSIEDFLEIGLRPEKVISAVDEIPNSRTVNVKGTTDEKTPSKAESHDRQAVLVPPAIDVRKDSFARKQPPISASRNFGQGNKRQQHHPYEGCLDFQRLYDPDGVSQGGQAVVTTEPLPVSTLCFLCGSAGKEEQQQMIVCTSCCEPFHSFCLDPDELPATAEVERSWACRRCAPCGVCGGCGSSDSEGGRRRRCVKCCRAFHDECLQPNQRKDLGEGHAWVR